MQEKPSGKFLKSRDDMKIRKAVESDISSIVGLLKLALGESLIPKTEAFWIWKHQANPFGESLILIAEQDGKLLGVRAFMKWQWKDNFRTWQALRAVDTAVHPDYQGKGIFTKLTKSLVLEAKEEGFDMVFNTPNQKSLPGYLKMGWRKLGYAPVQIQFNFILKNTKRPLPEEININDFERVVQKVFHFETNLISKNSNANFLIWRYLKCPQYKYQFISDENTYLLIYRIRETSFGRECRIVELFPLAEKKQVDFVSVKIELKKIQKEFGIAFSSIMKSNKVQISGFMTLPVSFFLPLITVKPLSKDENFLNEIMDLASWQFTLGDLELF